MNRCVRVHALDTMLLSLRDSNEDGHTPESDAYRGRWDEDFVRKRTGSVDNIVVLSGC